MLMRKRRLKPLISAFETRESELYTTKHLGIPSEYLMENAGLAVGQLAIKCLRMIENASVVILAGPGNNGADALIAARHLMANGIECQIHLVDPIKNNSFVNNQIRILKSLAACFLELRDLGTDKPLLVIDGILGSGLNRPPDGQYLSAIEFVNKNALHIISIDIPSGLSLDAKRPLGGHIKAHHTITFGPLKQAHISEPTKSYCGRVRAYEIGLFRNFPITSWWVPARKCMQELFLPIPHPCHKGKFGHVVIFEGHSRFYGASHLCAYAALRVGAGLLTLASARKIPPNKPYEFMHIELSSVDDDFLSGIDAVVVGPGLSLDPKYQNLALCFLQQVKESTLIVLDAQGLPLLHNPALNLNKQKMICTPHPKEAAKLLNCSVQEIENDRFSAISKLGETFGGLWLLKGETPLIRSLDKNIYAFRGDLPLLSTGGMGDILSGAIAGLYKQTATPIEALLLATSMQLHAASLLSKKATKGILSSELADQFPHLTERMNA